MWLRGCLVLFLVSGLGSVVGCGGVSDEDDDDSGDGDADSDADGDADADGDGDSDGDGDGDADADGDGDADADGDADGDYTLEEVCDLVGAALCEASSACCTGGWTQDEITICSDSFSLSCQANMNASVATGNVVIEGAAVGDCIDAFEAAWGACPEGEPRGVDAACDAVFVGQLDAGAACNQDEECVAGLECAWRPNDERTCTRMPVAGDPCLEGNCARGFQCNWQTSLCYEVQQLGEACEDIDEWNDTCAYELHCAGGLCRADFAAGHVCADGTECISGNCTNGTCQDGGNEPRDWCDATQFVDH